jgi:hypothetical protein
MGMTRLFMGNWNHAIKSSSQISPLKLPYYLVCFGISSTRTGRTSAISNCIDLYSVVYTSYTTLVHNQTTYIPLSH